MVSWLTGANRPRSKPLRQAALAAGQLLVYGTVASHLEFTMADSAVQKSAENGQEQAIVRALGRPLHRAGRHDGRRQVVGRPPAGGPAGLPFVDADTEIENAAGMTIAEIFASTASPISAPAKRG